MIKMKSNTELKMMWNLQEFISKLGFLMRS